MLMVNRITVKHVSWVRQHYTNNVQIYEIIRHDFIQTILHDFYRSHTKTRTVQTSTNMQKTAHTHTHSKRVVGGLKNMGCKECAREACSHLQSEQAESSPKACRDWKCVSPTNAP